MEVVNKFVCKDVCSIIDSYVNGDKQYWKSQFNECMTELLTFKSYTHKLVVTVNDKQTQIITTSLVKMLTKEIVEKIDHKARKIYAFLQNNIDKSIITYMSFYL